MQNCIASLLEGIRARGARRGATIGSGSRSAASELETAAGEGEGGGARPAARRSRRPLQGGREGGAPGWGA